MADGRTYRDPEIAGVRALLASMPNTETGQDDWTTRRAGIDGFGDMQPLPDGVAVETLDIAGLAALGLEGNYTYFGITDARIGELSDWILVLACGVGGGVLGAGFSVAALRATRYLRRFVATDPLKKGLLVAAACGSSSQASHCGSRSATT